MPKPYDKYEFYKTVTDLRADGLTWRDIAEHYDIKTNTAKKRYGACKALFEGEGETPEPASDSVTGNYRTIVGDRVKSVDQLLKVFEVDLDDWIITNAVVETWEMGRRKETKKISWVGDGLIGEGSFSEDTGEITPTTLYKVKVWLVRKHPVAVSPVIQPITMRYKPRLRGAPKKKAGGLNIALALPDWQVGFHRDLETGALTPFHDRLALDIALQIAGVKHFDMIGFLGDIVDLTDWQDRFARIPEHTQTTQASLIEVVWWLSQFCAASPRGKKAMIEGNHEIRMINYIAKVLPAAHNLKAATKIDAPPALSVPGLLALDDLGIEWYGGYPDAKVWLNDAICLTHGDRVSAQPGATARAMVDRVDHSTVFGHIHRRERATRLLEQRNGSKIITALTPGCLCKTDGTVPGSNMRSNWQKGIAVIYYDPDGTYHAIETIEIEDNRAVWGGEVFEGRNRLPDIIEDTGYKFDRGRDG